MPQWYGGERGWCRWLAGRWRTMTGCRPRRPWTTRVLRGPPASWSSSTATATGRRWRLACLSLLELSVSHLPQVDAHPIPRVAVSPWTETYSVLYRVRQKSKPLKLFAVFSATIGNFTVKLYMLVWSWYLHLTAKRHERSYRYFSPVIFARWTTFAIMYRGKISLFKKN